MTMMRSRSSPPLSRCILLFANILAVVFFVIVAGPSQRIRAQAATLNLRDFGAVGNGVVDDGPALQNALNALAEAGGGAMFVPEGRYAIITPVSKDFAGLAVSISIIGVESSTPVVTTGPGEDLSQGLDLVSEFRPRTTSTQVPLAISGLKTLLIKDISWFGNPDVGADALIVLRINDVEESTIRHCEFYGLSSQSPGGAIISSIRSGLRLEQSKFLGSTGNSGVYVPVVDNLEWKSIAVSDCVFLDYGQRPELFSKTGVAAPLSWINIGNAAVVTSDSPRREVSIDTVFLDEGAWQGITSLPDRYQPPSAPIDLVYVTALRMNVSNLDTSGNYLDHLRAVLIENSRYQWSHNADAAIRLFGVGNAILDRLECVDSANTIGADAATQQLTIIDSIYDNLDSQAQRTDIINTVNPDDDHVSYVRQLYDERLGREPDPAGHFYWSNLILQCRADAQCVANRRASLNSYLDTSPPTSFNLGGRVTADNGVPLSDVLVTLSGSQTVTTGTDAAGNYGFSGLPTSGVYTVSVSKKHYTFDSPAVTITTPPGNQIINFPGHLNHHTISGKVADETGQAVPGATITLSGAGDATMITGLDGRYSFADLPAGETYTVTPSRPNNYFSPNAKTVEDLGTDQNLDFTLELHTINGRVTDINNQGIAGISVVLTGSESAITTTDQNGDFLFPNLPGGGTYVATASLKYYSFAPPSYTFNNLDRDSYAGFVMSLNQHTIGGRVVRSNGSALAGVTITLSGPQPRITTSDAAGNYSFNLAAGENYTLTLSKTNHSFSPASVTVVGLDGDKQYDFTGVPVHYRISGRITMKTVPLSGIIVRLGGSETKLITTDAAGEFSFSIPVEQAYTITPLGTGYAFTPSSINGSNLIQNQVVDFTAQLNPGMPVLITEPASTRAIAGDSVLGTTEPFDLIYDLPWSNDRRTRIVLFATNFELLSGETASAVTVEAQDASGRIFNLPVEYVEKATGVSWLNRVIVRLNDDLGDVGDVLLRITYHGNSSNRVRVGIGHVGGGPPDDPNSVPVPGLSP